MDQSVEIKKIPYETLLKKQKRKLSAIIKTDDGMSYEGLHKLVKQKLANLYEFYTTCEDVEDDKEIAKIVESLEECLVICDHIEVLEGFTSVALQPSEIEVVVSEPVEDISDIDEEDVPPTERGLTVEEYGDKASQLTELYKKLYKTIGEHILDWWF